MRVLSIGTDRKLFEKESAVLARNIEYAKKMDELHIVVFTTSRKSKVESYKVGNLYVYPTNSTSRWFYIFDAYRIGKQVIKNCKLKIENLTRDMVITSQDPFETGLVGYFLRRKFNFPLQLQAHTDFLSLHFSNSFLNKFRVKIAKFLIPRVQGIRVVSSVISDSIKKEFPNLKIVPDVLPVFVDIEEIINRIPTIDLKKQFPQFSFLVIVASRLTKEKRIDVALRAFKEVVGEFSHAGLIIAGEGSEKSNLENLVKRLGLGDKVFFVGWRNDLVSIYKTTNLFLNTSEYEGYGMSLVEAAASGSLIVTTEVGVAKTELFVNDENCFVCPVGDVECLSKSILELIKNNVKRELFKRAMQDSIKSIAITKEEYTAKYVSLLEKLINSNDQKNH